MRIVATFCTISYMFRYAIYFSASKIVDIDINIDSVIVVVIDNDNDNYNDNDNDNDIDNDIGYWILQLTK